MTVADDTSERALDDASERALDDASERALDDASEHVPVGGTYTLVVECPDPVRIDVGALGEREFPAGAYAYTGSALGSSGFSRVCRHRRTARGDNDVRHWHVDYLLGHPAVRIDRVVYGPGADVECAVADRLPDGPVEGFGASDCDCSSHLSWTAEPADLIDRVVRAYESTVEAGARRRQIS